MIIKLGGGREGLKDYLEHGRKSGRTQHRNELDERVPLFGNLTLFHNLTEEPDYGNGRRALGVQVFGFVSRRCRYGRVYATRLGPVSSVPRVYRFQLAELEVYGKNE